MFRRFALLAATIALLGAAPAFAQQGGTADREFSRLNADRAHRLGVQQYRAQNYDQALRQFEKAVALAPDVDNYRRSLALTRQRIATDQVNQRNMLGNSDRTRRSFGDDDPSSEPEGRPAAADSPPDSAAAKDDPKAARAPESPESFVRAPEVGGETMQRESQMRSGIPDDLPIGDMLGNLPIGRLPDELLTVAPNRRPIEDAAELPAEGTTSPDAILKPDMFPSLYPSSPSQSAPVPGEIPSP